VAFIKYVLVDVWLGKNVPETGNAFAFTTVVTEMFIGLLLYRVDEGIGSCPFVVYLI
jgi:hypothetical protein